MMKIVSHLLCVSDFDFISKHRSEKEVIGSVRRKIQILPLLATIFQMQLQAEEDFVKGKISCSLATADNMFTIGFADTAKLRLKTLLKNNELNSDKAVNVTLVLRRDRGADKFDTIIQGDVREFIESFPEVLVCGFLDGVPGLRP